MFLSSSSSFDRLCRSLFKKSVQYSGAPNNKDKAFLTFSISPKETACNLLEGAANGRCCRR